MFATTGAVLAAAQFAAAQDQPWHPLFDGSTSKGWVEVTGKPFPTHSWTVEDGCLKALVRTDGFEDIRTVETFKSLNSSSNGSSRSSAIPA